MSSQRQIDTNRRNALLSTGPRTEVGKQQSRGNAYRHGLTAETVIVGTEDAAEYSAFEAEIVSEYDPKSVVERELTRRLASLLWRLRRANLIEAGLLSLYSKPTPDREKQSGYLRKIEGHEVQIPAVVVRRLHLTKNSSDRDQQSENLNQSYPTSNVGEFKASARGHIKKQQTIATYFLRLADLDSQPLERNSLFYKTSN